MHKLRIGFYGTPEIAASLLHSILVDQNCPLEIIYVTTQPDKPVGRKQVITPSPVKKLAMREGIQVYTDLRESTNRLADINFALVFAYGEIIPVHILRMSTGGFWNIHPSLLPKYRGASPIAYPVLLGDDWSGVTLMKMDEKMDHGRIIAQQRIPIVFPILRSDLEKNLIHHAYDILKKTAEQMVNNPARFSDNALQEQNHELATYTRTLEKHDGFIPFNILNKCLNDSDLHDEEIPAIIQDYFKRNFTNNEFIEWRNKFTSSAVLFNLYRGLYNWPGIWTLVTVNQKEKRLKITEMSFKDDKLTIEKIQLEGKNEVDMKTFNSAYKIFPE